MTTQKNMQRAERSESTTGAAGSSAACPSKPVDLLPVGGQAVLEGVMMRSPRSFVVVCRRPDGRIALRESPWQSAWNRLRFLRWPFLRGGVVFWETLQNGLQALSFSAQQQSYEPAPSRSDEAAASDGDGQPAARGEQEDSGAGADEEPEGGPAMGKAAITGTIVLSLALGFALFAVLPHLLTFLAGQLTGTPLDGKSVAFHVVDALFKLLILLAYMWGISRMKEIQRVFMYHGAEHKSIFTYEAGEELTVENARKYTTHHPRCGTSFLLLVILVSILVFTGVFSGPWMPVFSTNRWLNQLVYVLIKLPLMFPIAGIAYEFLKLSGKRSGSKLLRPFILPGLWLQRITTKEPTDDMLEIALLSLRKVLWREAQPQQAQDSVSSGVTTAEPEVFDSLEQIDLPLMPQQPAPQPRA